MTCTKGQVLVVGFAFFNESKFVSMTILVLCRVWVGVREVVVGLSWVKSDQFDIMSI